MDTIQKAIKLAATGDYSSFQRLRRRAPSKANDVQNHPIEPLAEIFGSDGVYVGSVAEVDGDLIKLGASEIGLDSRPNHYIPLSLVDGVENGAVRLKVKASEAVSFEKGATTYDPVKTAPPA